MPSCPNHAARATCASPGTPLRQLRASGLVFRTRPGLRYRESAGSGSLAVFPSAAAWLCAGRLHCREWERKSGGERVREVVEAWTGGVVCTWHATVSALYCDCVRQYVRAGRRGVREGG